MKTIHREALRKLGVEVEDYRVEGRGMPSAIGIALTQNGHDLAVIEQVPRGWGGDNKWTVWSSPVRSRPGQVEETINGVRIRRVGGIAFRTQREAIAHVVRAGLLTPAAPVPARETERERWVRRTRESVARALVTDQVPLRARDLEDNLDITRYTSGLGFRDQRTEREISAACRWLVAQGYADAVTFERDDYDYQPGVHYAITPAGVRFARSTSSEN